MPTKADITNSINTITDGGNNTASKVRGVLTALLNFTENPAPVVIPTIPTVDYLSLTNGATAITSVAGGATLSYTLKGIKTQLMNMKLKINFITAIKIHQFIIPPAQRPDFNLIFPASTAPLSFIVPLEIGTTKTYKSWTLQIGFVSPDKLSVNLFPSANASDIITNTQLNTIIPLMPK